MRTKEIFSKAPFLICTLNRSFDELKTFLKDAIVLVVLAAIISIILLALAAVISGIIDNKISSKEYVTTNVECIAREKSTDLSVLPISTGETVSMLPHYSESYKTVFQYKGMKLESCNEDVYEAVKKGETYTAEIEVRTYPNSAKKKYDIVSIHTENKK